MGSIENADEIKVRRLLVEDADVDETFKGWILLMKTAEENHVDILQLLLNSRNPT